MTPSNTQKTVLITGAGGNLGSKAVTLLEAQDWCNKVIALHAPFEDAPPPRGKVTSYTCDLRTIDDEWPALFKGVDTVVHFAAQKPYAESDWGDTAASSDITFNVGLAAADAGVRRFVNTSSNHAIGGYKDEPLSSSVKNGGMSEDLSPAPGTKWNNGTVDLDSTPYGVSKVMAERFFSALCASSNCDMTAISIRIGWALEGENDPSDISISGSPTGQSSTSAANNEEAKTLRWFRNMWLSNGDFDRLMVRAILSDTQNWPQNSIIINGVSDNTGSDWSLANAAKYIGYQPEHDIYALLPENNG